MIKKEKGNLFNDSDFPEEISDSEENIIKDYNEILNLGFNGKAVVVFEKERSISSNINGDNSDYKKLIHILNNNSGLISELISGEISKSLSEIAPNLSVSIDFKDGSVEWYGLITVTVPDFLSRLDGVIGGIKVILDIVKFAINKVVRSQIENNDTATVKKIDTNVKEKKVKEKSIHILTRFFWWCSGAVTEILQNHAEDKSKYQTIGAAVFSTGLLAFCSGGYAFYTVFKDNDTDVWFTVLLAIIFGLIWGMIIFNIDRSIVSSMRKDDNNDGISIKHILFESRLALPRIVLAVILVLVISKPLELKIFNNKISKKVSENKLKQTKNYLDSLRVVEFSDRINNANYKLRIEENNLKSAHEEAREYALIFNNEMDANGGTGRYGYGSVAIKKENDKNRALRKLEMQEVLVDSLQNDAREKMRIIEAEIAMRLFSYNSDFNDDLSEKLQALEEIKVTNSAINSADNGIIMLFVILELVPIFVKLFSQTGKYDSELNKREKIFLLNKKNDLSIASIHMNDELKKVLAKQEDDLIEANLKKETSERIIRYRMDLLSQSETEMLDHFFQESRDIRLKELRSIIKDWTFRAGNDLSSSFDNLYRFVQKLLGINTKQ